MKLVLIEGPGKRDSVQHYLGNGYKVMPTFGHCRDLPEKTLAVDIENKKMVVNRNAFEGVKCEY